jgi:hypothetical protein
MALSSSSVTASLGTVVVELLGVSLVAAVVDVQVRLNKTFSPICCFPLAASASAGLEVVDRVSLCVDLVRESPNRWLFRLVKLLNASICFSIRFRRRLCCADLVQESSIWWLFQLFKLSNASICSCPSFRCSL